MGFPGERDRDASDLGDPGEPITGGLPVFLSDSTSAFAFAQPVGGFECDAGSPAWSLRFRGATARPLGTGIYAPLVASPSNNEPMMDEGHLFSTCRPAAGSFHVRKLAISPDGSVRQAWITWTAQCVTSGPRQYGDLRVNADTSLWQALPADVWCFGGDTASFDVQAFDAAARPVTFQVADLPPGSSFDDSGDGTGRFRWKTSPVGLEQIVPVSIIASDDRMLRDTVTAVLHIEPNTLLIVASDPGDPLGRGRTDVLRSASTVVRLSEGLPKSGVQLQYEGAGHSYRFSLAAPFGRGLEEGTFDGALRSPSQPAVLPGFDVSVDGTGCNINTGGFVVRRLARDAHGTVTGLWATLEQHCDGSVPGLRAELRFDIDTTLYVQVPADVNVEPGDSVRVTANAISTIGRAVSLQASGLPLDATSIGQGSSMLSFRWRAPSTTGEWDITLAAADDAGNHVDVVVRVHILAPDRFVVASTPADCSLHGITVAARGVTSDFSPLPRGPTEAWVNVLGAPGGMVSIRAPFGAALQKGSYTLGQYDYTGADRIFGTFGFGIGANGTSPRLASVQVRKLSIDAYGYARSLWVTWQGGCPTPPTDSGEIIFNADTSLSVQAPAIARVERGRSLQFGVASLDAAGAAVQLSCPVRPAGSAFTPGPGGTATFSWPGTAQTGDYNTVFVGSDGSGTSDTVSTTLRVVPPQRMVMTGTVGEALLGNGGSRLDATNGNFVAFAPGAADLVCYGLGQTWEFKLVAPYSRSLTPGVFTQVSRADAYKLSRSLGFDVSFNAAVPHVDSGAVHIRKVAFGPDARLSQLWATIDVVEGTSHLRGELRFGDPDTSLYLSAPADIYSNPGDPVTFTVRATPSQPRPVAFTAHGVPSSAAFRDNGDGTGTLTWLTSGEPGTTTPITVVATDDLGRQDSSLTFVHDVVPAVLTTSRDPNAFDGWPRSVALDATRAEFNLSAVLSHGAMIRALSPTENWVVSLDAPGDGRLMAKNYPDAVGGYAARGSHPLLDVSSGGSTCTFGAHGSFTILDVGYDAAGKIASLWATFKDSCYQEGLLSGEVRFGSAQTTVGVLASRVLASGVGGVVHLRWRVNENAGSSFPLERRDPGGDSWHALAELTPDGQGDLSFTDEQVEAGRTYSYRLVASSAAVVSLDQVEVTVSAAGEFAIRSVGPNPATGSLALETSGAPPGPLSLTLLDIAGRTAWRASLPPDRARASATLDLPGSLRAGIYVLRVQWSTGRIERRIVLVR